jgi:PAS domain S-box-containing protein
VGLRHGQQGDKFIGLQIPEIIHPDDVEMVRLAWGGIFNERKELKEFEYRIIDEQGATRWVSHSAKTHSINSEVIGVLSTIRNITGHKIAEEAIKVSEEKYKTMLNASPDCMVLTNMTGVIIEVSEIGLHLFGAKRRDDLVGENIFDFVPSDEHNLLTEMLVRTTNEGFAQNVGITIKKQNQTVFAGEISATLMQDANGAPLSLMIIVRDISQRKKKEARQIHADRMSTLGEMAAGIAHEINQPLNIISILPSVLIQAS